MYLKKLELNGFKSFAKKTTLEFTRGITAIVGPNGAGKSNIADAIRWVTGEQSIKTLRGKKGEDVIFSGSDKKARLGLAEVSLYLDNRDHKIPLDYSEIVITRRIYRNGESDYLLNNSKTRLSDINLLLTKANFGHRTYSVIGQGMIDNFLIATPQERKEFFEEATGVKQYQIKKNQALNKLQNSWQNLQTVKIKIQEMEPQLRLLTRQVKKLNKRKQIEKELEEKRLYYYSSYWQEIDQEYNQHKQNIDKLNSQHNNLFQNWKILEEQINKITQDNNSNQQIDKLRQEQQELLDKKMQLKEKLLTLKVEQANQAKSALKQVRNISAQELTSLNQKIQYINLLHQKLIEQLDHEKNIDLIKQEIVNINKKIDDLVNFLKPYIQPQIKTLKALRIDKKTEKINNINQQISEIDKQNSSLQARIKQITQEDQNQRSSLWQSQQNYQNAQDKLNQVNNKINQARVNLARIETKRFDLKQEINYELHSLDNLFQEPQDKISEQEKLTLLNKINRLKNQLEVVGGIDPEIEAEYQTTQQRYDFLSQQAEDLAKTTESLKKLITDLDQIIKKQIDKSFIEINNYFKKYFKILFSGGRAELTLVKNKEKEKSKEEIEEDEESTAINFFQEKSDNTYSGIEIQATPPGKKLKSINVLSGGERALTSIALVCAIISSNPSPFIVLDEVDAALDESNSLRFAQILQDISKHTQFIIITHNRATMEKAKLLYGVTMSDDGVSKLFSIKLDEAKKFDKKS